MPPLSLPWPVAALSPNSRVHRMVKARAVKRYRNDCGFAALEAGWRRVAVESLDVRITFLPPDNRRRDTDGMISSVKALIDGLADVLGVDDSRWRMTFERGEPVRGGAVRVEVSACG